MKIKTFEVVAKFALILFLLIPSTAGATGYTLTVSAQGSGSVTKNPTNAIYPSGATVTLTATPNAGWYFANWSGDTNGSVNPLNVTMNTDLVITGNFLAYPTYSVTLATNGQGSLVLNPAGGIYMSNTIVTAIAIPTPGWVFMNWSGATNTNLNLVRFTLNTNLFLTGTFTQLPAFDQQPVSATNAVGSTVNFSAHAVGTSPLSYRWFFSGGSLSSSTTNMALTLTNISSSQAGSYWVVASNNYGSMTSHLASLTITNTTGPTNMVNVADEASLRAAIGAGGWVGLGFNGVVTLTSPINITRDVYLDGRTLSVVISGGNSVRLFYVAPSVTFGVTNLTIADGNYVATDGTTADAGAIYNDGGLVILTRCTLTNNAANAGNYGGMACGGAIFNNEGIVSLQQSSILNNTAVGGGYVASVFGATGTGLGGAIYNSGGSVMITACNFNGNSCAGIPYYWSTQHFGSGLSMGGGVYQSSGFLLISNSLFSLNQALGGNSGGISPPPAGPGYGGAIAIIGDNLTIEHSQFVSNSATGGNPGLTGPAGAGFGGAVYSTATWNANDSSFVGNRSLAGNYMFDPGMKGFGGAIYNAGTGTINRCSIYSNNVQGGITYPYGGSGYAKGAQGLGGGIFNAAQIAATNCTIALNVASGSVVSEATTNAGYGAGGDAFGGGVFNNTNAIFIGMNLTIASNRCTSPSGFGFTNGLAAGCQIANTNGTLRLHNSLVAYGGTNSNAYGPITDDGYNISSDGSANFASGSSYNFTDPQLAPLGDYGGPTWCMALLPTSPAIDFGDSVGIPNTDQRGFVRPFGSGADIGAYESGSYLAGVLQLNITATKTNISLSFTATPPNAYRLQASTNLIQWTDLNTNGPFASVTNINQTINQQGFNRRYFRLLVQ